MRVFIIFILFSYLLSPIACAIDADKAIEYFNKAKQLEGQRKFLEAIFYYEQSAQNGYFSAPYELGRIYETGKGTQLYFLLL